MVQDEENTDKRKQREFQKKKKSGTVKGEKKTYFKNMRI